MRFLVAYKRPDMTVRAKWVEADYEDEARNIVRQMKKTDPTIYFVVVSPIAILDSEIDNPQ